LTTRSSIGSHNTSSDSITLVGVALVVGSNTINEVLATSGRVARISVALVSELATRSSIGSNNTSSGRITLVCVALVVGSDRVQHVFATSGRIARVSVALVSLLASIGNISDIAFVRALVSDIRLQALHSVASSFSRAVSVKLAGNFAGA
jgi:hypothetical protein